MRGLAFAIIFIVFGFINYWIGYNGWNHLFKYISMINVKLYWIVFWIISLSYIVGRAGERVLPHEVSNAASIIGSYWVGAMLYFILLIIIIKTLTLLNKIFRIIPIGILDRPQISLTLGLSTFIVVLCIVGYGIWNARHPKITSYDIRINKPSNIASIRLVAMSDVHIGKTIGRGFVERLVDMTNGLKPDIVLLIGDIIDESPIPYERQDIKSVLGKLNTKYGVYGILGNHEYIGENVVENAKQLEESGIVLLKDQAAVIDGGINLIGRDDISGRYFGGAQRKPLKDIVGNLDLSKPTILMDHQPMNFSEAEALGIDLQLSGHTHGGQIFPANLIVNKIYEKAVGYLQKGNFHAIVSSGAGVWGPPMRVGTTPEIVVVNIMFKSK